MDFGENFLQCVVPENIHTPPRMVNGNSQGVRGLKRRSFQGVWGVGHVNNFQEALTSQIILHKLTVSILIWSAPKP